jgi:AraC-like DNA-binding protein
MLLIQGELNLHLDDDSFLLKPGMLAFCPKGCRFRRWSDKPSWWIYIYLFDKPVWDSLKHPGCYIRDYESTEHFLLLLSRILESRQKQTIKDRLNALEYSRSLADLIKREARIFEKNKNPHLEKLKRLAAKIHFAPESPWTVPLMAKTIHLSPRSLNRLFHREYGMGPMDYVINKRLNRALEMLIYTDDKIEAVASSLGYRSLNSFSNLFLSHIGLRPGEFRNKYLSEK